MILEICCGDINSVIAAIDGGADRIELCSALSEGGLTPSYGLMKQTVKICHEKNVRVNVLIRPRSGDFCYSPEEEEIMAIDISIAHSLNADGIVIGALKPSGEIDTSICRRLLNVACDMDTTFHRAFDMCKDPNTALEDIISLGFKRILTSGCSTTALQGIEIIKDIKCKVKDRICIMAGCGINSDNALEIIKTCDINEIHASVRRSIPSNMTYKNGNVKMGSKNKDEYSQMITDAEEVRIIKNLINL